MQSRNDETTVGEVVIENGQIETDNPAIGPPVPLVPTAVFGRATQQYVDGVGRVASAMNSGNKHVLILFLFDRESMPKHDEERLRTKRAAKHLP
ncbi:MAG: hypothetical protein HC826_02460 [Rhodospirillales bacterium]|nr:hypothetical protein [Rhodospirillales bacterium]